MWGTSYAQARKTDSSFQLLRLSKAKAEDFPTRNEPGAKRVCLDGQSLSTRSVQLFQILQ